jgi:WhiB family redox-sensing transcriptional regulator
MLTSCPPSEFTFDTLPKEYRDQLPCRVQDPDLWFAEAPVELERAKAFCRSCPVQAACLRSALDRAEPWGVWGGEIFEAGAVIARKRPRGRPRKNAPRPVAA